MKAIIKIILLITIYAILMFIGYLVHMGSVDEVARETINWYYWLHFVGAFVFLFLGLLIWDEMYSEYSLDP